MLMPRWAYLCESLVMKKREVRVGRYGWEGTRVYPGFYAWDAFDLRQG
jgi:hypothetical protein